MFFNDEPAQQSAAICCKSLHETLDYTQILQSMKILHFKTNINCSSCVSAVKPFLDKEESINNWQVDTTGKDKMLRVSGQQVNPDRVISLVQEAGFKAEEV